jgi:hypothetical protein
VKRLLEVSGGAACAQDSEGALSSSDLVSLVGRIVGPAGHAPPPFLRVLAETTNSTASSSHCVWTEKAVRPLQGPILGCPFNGNLPSE